MGGHVKGVRRHADPTTQRKTFDKNVSIFVVVQVSKHFHLLQNLYLNLSLVSLVLY